MFKRFRFALAVVVVIAALTVANVGLRMMNVANDIEMYAGIVLVLAVFVLGPAALALLFRKRRVEGETEKGGAPGSPVSTGRSK